jgi:GNAT superfamily N-acetyltransferase
MALATESGSAIAVVNLKEFFHDSVQQALHNQHVEVEAQTEHYLVTVLTRFARADQYFEGPGRGQRPLANLLADALEAPHPEQRRERMQRLGDISLFMAGFFAQSFARRLVDVDYIAMGGRAYGSLADSWRGKGRGAVFSVLFAELALKFQRLVDVLNEVADMARPASDQDVLRLYEIWQKTSSPRAHRLLQQRGVVPLAVQARA